VVWSYTEAPAPELTAHMQPHKENCTAIMDPRGQPHLASQKGELTDSHNAWVVLAAFRKAFIYFLLTEIHFGVVVKEIYFKVL